MKKPDRLTLGAAVGMAAALVFYAGSGAWAQLDTDTPGGHLKIQTAIETDWGVHTAGKDNRNNNNNNIPGSGQGFSTNGNVCSTPLEGSIPPSLSVHATTLPRRWDSTTPTSIFTFVIGETQRS